MSRTWEEKVKIQHNNEKQTKYSWKLHEICIYCEAPIDKN